MNEREAAKAYRKARAVHLKFALSMRAGFTYRDMFYCLTLNKRELRLRDEAFRAREKERIAV